MLKIVAQVEVPTGGTNWSAQWHLVYAEYKQKIMGIWNGQAERWGKCPGGISGSDNSVTGNIYTTYCGQGKSVWTAQHMRSGLSDSDNNSLSTMVDIFKVQRLHVDHLLRQSSMKMPLRATLGRSSPLTTTLTVSSNKHRRKGRFFARFGKSGRRSEDTAP